MKSCVNPTIGDMLHAYELKQLSPEETEQFDLHLLECEVCFEKIGRFEKIADIMTGNSEVKQEMADLKFAKEGQRGFWQKLKASLWPNTRLFLKPAIGYLMILILAYPAYLGIRDQGEGDIRQVETLTLVPNRSVSADIVAGSSDILLSFVFRGAVAGKDYSVRIADDRGRTIYSNDHFNEFDNYEVGKLLLTPSAMPKGEYTLIIRDKDNKTPLARQEYTFRVR